MKYIVIAVKTGEITRELPFVFPSIMVHSQVAQSLIHRITISHGWNDAHLVSAGEVSFFDGISCSGKSTTLGLESRGAIDEELIRMFDYFHGVY